MNLSRVEKIRELLAVRELDALLVYDELNQRYLSNFAFTDGLLIITRESAYLVTDFRYFEMAENEAFSDFKVVIPDKRSEFIEKTLKCDSCRRVGFEGGKLSYADYHNLCETYSFCEFVNIGNMIEVLRQVKDEEEIELIQKAQDITDNAFSLLLERLTPNMTEIEVAAELEYLMRRNGASGLAFETIAVSGDASALPHGTPRNVKLKKGFLTLDFGAKYNGYCSDMTRSVVIGRANEEIKRVYNTVLSAQTAALEYIRAGVECSAVDKVARDIIDAVPEFKGTFGHSLGHGVGLFIHEEPRFSSRASGIYALENQICTVEPGIYLYGKFGCRIEDMVAVKPNGIHNFTHSTKELIEIL